MQQAFRKGIERRKWRSISPPYKFIIHLLIKTGNPQEAVREPAGSAGRMLEDVLHQNMIRNAGGWRRNPPEKIFKKSGKNQNFCLAKLKKESIIIDRKGKGKPLRKEGIKMEIEKFNEAIKEQKYLIGVTVAELVREDEGGDGMERLEGRIKALAAVYEDYGIDTETAMEIAERYTEEAHLRALLHWSLKQERKHEAGKNERGTYAALCYRVHHDNSEKLKKELFNQLRKEGYTDEAAALEVIKLVDRATPVAD